MIWVEGSEARQVEQPHLQDVRENVLLHVCIVHSDGAATDLDAIQDEVVMLPAYLSTCFPIFRCNCRTAKQLASSAREGKGFEERGRE